MHLVNTIRDTLISNRCTPDFVTGALKREHRQHLLNDYLAATAQPAPRTPTGIKVGGRWNLFPEFSL